MPSKFFLHDRILMDFGVDLPITGGDGTSNNPFHICLDGDSIYDIEGTENVFLLCLGLGRGSAWKLLSREQLEMNGRLLDKLRIEREVLSPEDDEEEEDDDPENDEIATEIVAYYFDVTDFVGKSFKKHDRIPCEIVVPDFFFEEVDATPFIGKNAGTSIDYPIIFRYGIGPNDYVGAEYQYAKLFIKKNFDGAKFVDQALLRVGDRKIDRLRYLAVNKDGPKCLCFFFDVTDCFGK